MTTNVLRSLRRLALVPVFLLSLGAGSARATAFGTNHTDQWWVPAESGWGMNLMQEADVVFATLFVYDPSGSPIWYTATLEFRGNLTYSGDLYVTGGPWFGTVFAPASVGLRKVGTLQTVMTDVDHLNLTYSVDGVLVTKKVQRQTLRYECFCGNYVGAFEVTRNQCTTPFGAGDAETIGTMSLAQDIPRFEMTFQDTAKGTSCTYSGNYSQSGHLGMVNATYSCSDGESGRAILFEMEVSVWGFTGRIEASSQTCASIKGHFGGVRRLQAETPRPRF